MTLVTYSFLVLVVIIGLLLIRKYTTLEFVSHAKLLFKTWSVWLAAIGSTLSAWVQSFPQSALDAWNVLPPDIKSYIPPNYLGMVGAFMVVMGIIAQFVRQRKLLEHKQQMDNQP